MSKPKYCMNCGEAVTWQEYEHYPFHGNDSYCGGELIELAPNKDLTQEELAAEVWRQAFETQRQRTKRSIRREGLRLNTLGDFARANHYHE